MTEGKMLRFSAVLLLWSHIFSTTVQDIVLGQCLTTTDTKVPQKNLFSYTIQRKPLFPVDVVRFLTISGKVICSNPSSPWAKRSMKYLDAKNKPQSVSNRIARHSVTVVPKNMSTINATSAQSSTTPIFNRPTWEEKRDKVFINRNNFIYYYEIEHKRTRNTKKQKTRHNLPSQEPNHWSRIGEDLLRPQKHFSCIGQHGRKGERPSPY